MIYDVLFQLAQEVLKLLLKEDDKEKWLYYNAAKLLGVK